MCLPTPQKPRLSHVLMLFTSQYVINTENHVQKTEPQYVKYSAFGLMMFQLNITLVLACKKERYDLSCAHEIDNH
jgi:hypothetical protein